MLSLEEALERILAAAKPPHPVNVPLIEALGLSAAETVCAAVDLPPFDNSSMDGYAVRSEDLSGASPVKPSRLRVVDKIQAGSPGVAALEVGTCARIFTGGMIPTGADAVVMQEDVKLEAESGAGIFAESAKPWENVRFRGEDVKQGAPIVRVGDRILIGQIALLAACGRSAVRAHPRPRIGFVATGDELREGGEPLGPGQIYESNRAALAAQWPGCGAQPKLYPLIPDTLEATTKALEVAFAECDAVVTTGGVSVGEMDFVRAAFEKLGGQIEFWKIAVRPGKPFMFGRLNGKLLFGLPGNPVSAFVTFRLLVWPAIFAMRGIKHDWHPKGRAFTGESIANEGERRHFMRVRVEERKVRLAGRQESHLLGSLAAANGLLDVPPKTTLPAGTEVEVLYW